MQIDMFLSSLKERAGLESREQALQVARATLETLAERISENEANDLAAQLPHPLGDVVRARAGHSRRFGLDEFIAKVGEREGVGREDAERHLRAVAAILGQAVSRGELRDVCSQLPRDLKSLFEDSVREPGSPMHP